jgi:hypothetical protein
MSTDLASTPDWFPEVGKPPMPETGNDERSPVSIDWQNRLVRNHFGAPKTCVENALIALECAREWQGVLHFDESALKVVAKASPPWGARKIPLVWRDEDDVRTAAWMQRH